MAIVNAAPKQSDKTCALAERAVNNLVNLNSNETNDRAIWFLHKLYSKVQDSDRVKLKSMISKVYAKPENKRKKAFVKQLKGTFDFI